MSSALAPRSPPEVDLKTKVDLEKKSYFVSTVEATYCDLFGVRNGKLVTLT
jgi:hypothetical protein